MATISATTDGHRSDGSGPVTSTTSRPARPATHSISGHVIRRGRAVDDLDRRPRLLEVDEVGRGRGGRTARASVELLAQQPRHHGAPAIPASTHPLQREDQHRVPQLGPGRPPRAPGHCTASCRDPLAPGSTDRPSRREARRHAVRRPRRPPEHHHRGAPVALAAASRTTGSSGSRSGTTSTRPMRRSRSDGSVQSGYHCLEALTTHTALGDEPPTKVQCGSLVYCAGYRHPAVLANSIATLDQLSGGRVVLGLGGGWHQGEYRRVRDPVPVGRRHGCASSTRRSSACGSCFTEEVANFEGEHFQLRDARCEPKPVQARLPAAGRRRRREGHAAHRRPARRRLEPRVRHPRVVPAEGRGPRGALRGVRTATRGDRSRSP